MARKKTIKNKNIVSENKISKNSSFLENIQNSLNKDTSNLFPNKQSYLSLILGVFIVVVLAVLLYNYFNKPSGDLGPTGEMSTGVNSSNDVSRENLPGKYTVKEGDTLFLIAKAYYGDGYLYSEILKANNILNENLIEAGQVLEIPKVENVETSMSSPSPEPATGGAENETAWGEKITSDSYTVMEGDWLSKIAGRAYGDVMAYSKIAEANNISNPDLIEPGTVLKIPVK